MALRTVSPSSACRAPRSGSTSIVGRDDLLIDAADEVLAAVGVTKQDIDAYWLGMAASRAARASCSPRRSSFRASR